MTTYKGLTLEEIIECFINPSYKIDSKLLNIFLYTYRNYCDSMKIITLLNNRLHYLNEKSKSTDSNSEENEGFTKAVICFINNWLEFPFAYDFCELPNFQSVNYLLKQLQSWPEMIIFIKNSEEFKLSLLRLQDKINNVLNLFNVIGDGTSNNFRELPVDCEFKESFNIPMKQSEETINCSLLYRPAELIANSLTHLDQKGLQKLKLQEMLDHIRKLSAISVTSIIDRYNDLYNVVQLTVKDPSLAKKRYDQIQYSGRNSPTSMENVTITEPTTGYKQSDQIFQVIDKWIQIAQILSNMHNFSSLMAILTALNYPDNHVVMKKSSKLFNQFQSLLKTNEPHIDQSEEKMIIQSVNESKNSNVKAKGKLKNLKILLTEIPYLGRYLKHLAYIEEGFPDFLNPSANVYNGNEEHLINLDKCRRQFDVLVQVKLCISAIKNNEMEPDEPFLKWYSEVQKEMKKERDSLSISKLSLASAKSEVSEGSQSSCESENSKSLECGKSNILFHCQSNQSLFDDISRKRSLSSPTKSKHLTNDSKIFRVATVKFREPKISGMHLAQVFRSTNIPQYNTSKPYKKPETISNGMTNNHDRKPLTNIIRSSSTLNKDGVDTFNLENILYKKIRVYDSDHTSNFIERVFEKYRIPDLNPSKFEVVQILDNGREVVISDNANVFYALAEQPQYLIEVHHKKSKSPMS